MNKTFALILAIAAAASASCNRADTAKAGGKPTVALVLKTLNHPFFVDMQRGAQEAADRLGVTLQVQAAEREIDVEKQMQIVENLIQTGIQALVITPSGSREIVPALVKATQGEHPDRHRRHARRREGGGRRRREARDLRRLRQLRRRQARRRISREGHRRQGARRACSRGFPATKPATRGCAASATRVKDAPGITIVASQPANWERDQGFNVFQNMLQAHADIDSVFACSDLMALGAVEAIARGQQHRHDQT